MGTDTFPSLLIKFNGNDSGFFIVGELDGISLRNQDAIANARDDFATWRCELCECSPAQSEKRLEGEGGLG